jgi:hypothetical protein
LNVDDLAAKAVLLDPTLVHTEEHICPIARFCSSCARMDRQERVVLIKFARKKHLQLETFQLSQHGVILLCDLLKSCLIGLFFLLCQRPEDFKIIRLLDERGQGLHLCAKSRRLVDRGLGAILVIPEIGSRHLLLKFNQPRLQPRVVKDTSEVPLCEISVRRFDGPESQIP